MSLQTDTSTHLEIENYSCGDSKSDAEQFLPCHLPPMQGGWGRYLPGLISSYHRLQWLLHACGRKEGRVSGIRTGGRGRRKTISSSLVPRDQDREEGVFHKGRVH